MLRPIFFVFLAWLSVIEVCAATDAPTADTTQPRHEIEMDGQVPSYYRNREDGWFWYKDPPPPPKKPKVQEQTKLPKSKSESDALRARFDTYKKTLEDARIKAFFEPTPQNLAHYAKLQTELVQRADTASDVWQRVVWSNPNFDFTLERPVNRKGLDAWEETERGRKRNTFDRLASTSVLYFFFKSDCPYCHQFAPVLSRFSQSSGIRVFPVSLDGGGLKEFPKPHMNNGVAETLGVTSWPALFLGEPSKGRISPVGYGVMSDMELADRLVEIADPKSSAIGSATPIQNYSPGELQ